MMRSVAFTEKLSVYLAVASFVRDSGYSGYSPQTLNMHLLTAVNHLMPVQIPVKRGVWRRSMPILVSMSCILRTPKLYIV